MENLRLERVTPPAPPLDPRFTAIPDAPNPEALAAYATALVERARAILRFRLAERSSGEFDPAVAYEKVSSADVRIDELRAAHRFPLDVVCERLALDALDRHTLAFAAAPYLDDTFRDDIRRYRQSAGRAHVDAALVLEVIRPTRHEAIREARRFEVDWGVSRAGLIEYAPLALGRHNANLEAELVPTHHLLGLLCGQLGVHPVTAEHADLIRVDPNALVGELTPDRWAEYSAPLALLRPTALPRPPLLVVVGPVDLGLAVAHGVAAQWDRHSLIAFTPPAHFGADARLAVARRVATDAEFLGAVLVVVDRAGDAADPRDASLLRHALRLRDVPRIVLTPRPPDGVLAHAATLVVDTPEPDGSAVYRWVAELARASLGAPPELVDALAARAPWPRRRLATAIRAAIASTGDGLVEGHHLFTAIDLFRQPSEVP